MIAARPFPVMNPPAGSPRFVIWSSLDPDHAIRIHGHSLAALARRGGLSPCEIYGNVRRIPAKNYATIPTADALDLIARIAHHGGE